VKRFSSKTRVLQWIDHRLGVPACAVLTLVRRLGGIFRRNGLERAPRSILFLKLAEQGSTVLAYDVIRQAVARVGREQVYFLVFEENRFILDLLGLIPPENVFALQTRSAWAMVTSCLTQFRAIHRRRIEACIDLEFFARSSAALAFLSGARIRSGFQANSGDGPYRGDLLTHRVLYNPHLHTSTAFSSLLHALDVDPAVLPTFAFVPAPATEPPLFCPAAEEQSRVRELLANLVVPAGRRLILLNANAGDLLPQRKWDGANYVLLARRLLAEFPEVTVVFTGAQDEVPVIAPLVREVGSLHCVAAAGRTTLRELIVLYTFAEVLVTNDSGPAHFAALTPIDVVALFGPETPLLFAAPGPRSHPLWAGLACSPCVNACNNRQTSCRDNQCMKAHTVENVFDAVSRIYHRRRQQPQTEPLPVSTAH
jgi:ADP-heptose:LPS heptosyltransferase